MQAPRSPRSLRYAFNMTPMIDVVFLLIIFFLVSSHLAQVETRLDLPLPVAHSGDEDVQQSTPRVTINMREDGLLLLAGRPISVEQLSDRLQAARQSDGDDLEVRIRSSRLTPYQQVEPVLLACTRSGIWNVTFAVYRDENTR